MAILALVGCFGLDTLPSGEKQPGDDETSGTTVGALQLDVVAIDFGEVEVGATSQEALVLRNTGDAPLHVEAALTGPGAFTLETTSLDVDDSTALTVAFSPRSPEAYEGTVVLTVDETDSVEVPLTGVGTDESGGTTTPPPAGGPDIAVSPARYDFGLVDVGASDVATFTVTNNGDEDLLVADLRVDDRAFSVGGGLNPPQVLSPGASADIEVTFAPTAATAYTAELLLESDDADTETLSVALEGEGVDRCDVCTPIIDVDTGTDDPHAIEDFVSILGFADDREIIVRNLGDVDLVIDEVVVNNDVIARCGDFSTDFRGPETVPAFGSTLFTISYTGVGSCVELPYEALDDNYAHVLSNDPDDGDWEISLGGASLDG